MSLIQQLIQQIEENDLWNPPITLRRNEFLDVHGKVDRNLYFVISGSLRIFVVDEDEEQVIRFGYRDTFFAVLDSFLNSEPSDYYVQAIKETVLVSVSKKAFMDLVNESESNLKGWQMALEQLVLQQLERERDILTSSPKERYLRVLKRSPQLFQEIPNKHIASYLRMTPETLSRMKKLVLSDEA